MFYIHFEIVCFLIQIGTFHIKLIHFNFTCWSWIHIDVCVCASNLVVYSIKHSHWNLLDTTFIFHAQLAKASNINTHSNTFEHQPNLHTENAKWAAQQLSFRHQFTTFSIHFHLFSNVILVYVSFLLHIQAKHSGIEVAVSFVHPIHGCYH